MSPMTRDGARQAGIKHYYSDRLCAKGHVGKRDSRDDKCLACRSERLAVWKLANPDKMRDIARRAAKKWRDKNPEKARQTSKDWAKRNPELAAARSRRWAELNPEKRKTSRQRAGWKLRGAGLPTRPRPVLCECCGNPSTRMHHKTGAVHELELDHCHDSGEFRGWLCHHCNLGIGKLGDTIEGLERALDYLRRNPCPQLTAGTAPEKDGHPDNQDTR